MNKRMYPSHTPAANRLNNRLIVLTVAMPLFYIVAFVVQIWMGFGVPAPNLSSSLSLHPGSIILMCSVVAAIGVAFMPEIGKIFAGVALLAILVLFAYWGYVTPYLRANLPAAELDQFGLIGRWFIGATIVDLVMLVGAAVALVYDIQVIGKNLQSPSKKERLPNPPQPVMAEVPKFAKVAK